MITSLLIKFRHNPIQGTILSAVLAAHLIFILVILISPNFVHRKKEHKHLIVKTITPKSMAKTISTQKKPPSSLAPKVSAAPQAQPVSKKPEAPKPEVKKETAPPKTQAPPKKELAASVSNKQTPKPSPDVKKEPAIADKKLSPAKQPAKKTPAPAPRAKISDSLLQELEESIAKIDGKSDKTPMKRNAPSAAKAVAPIALQIDSLAANDSSDDPAEGDYTDVLIGHLHRSLSLPDYGEVKIQLSLRQDGSVAKVIVLKAQSEKNRQYLESNLPRLRFPRFEGVYLNKKEQTFVLTFCNEL